MSSTTDRTEIEALFKQLVRAHADRDADAIVEAYTPDAVIYDLAPPLGRRGMNRDRVAAWLASWDGPIQIDARDIDLTIEGDVAFASGSEPNARAPERRRPGPLVPKDDVSSENERAMANRPRSLVGALLHGWELSRRRGS